MNTTLHFVFTPTLNAWKDEDNNVELSFPSGYMQLDEMIRKNLLIDKTDIKNIMYPLRPLTYKYDVQTNLIHLWTTGNNLTDCDLANILDSYDPDNGGVDTWEEGDI